MNVLFIGDPSSIHDYKWTNFIARRISGRTFFIGEEPNEPDSFYKQKYTEAGITLLPPVPMFSISSPRRTWLAMKKINRLIRDNKIDLIHVIFPTPHLFWLTKNRVKTIVSTRGSDVLVVTRGLIEGGGIKNKILLRLLTFNLKKTAAVTSTSEAQEEYLLRHFKFLKGKTSIVRTGVDIDYIESIENPKKTTDKKIIFSPRFFAPIYNVVSQTNALKLLPKELQKQIKILFVKGKKSDARYEEEIMQALQNAYFEYEIVSYLSPQEMLQKYKTSDLVLMTPYSDGTPNSALEAMVCRTPLIVSDLPYNSPLFAETCLKANPNDENDIAAKIKTALENYPQDKIEKAYQAVKRYGNQATEMQKIIDLYQSLKK